MQNINVAIVGATGIVGTVLLDILIERKFPAKKIHLIASHRSAGETREILGQSFVIEDIATFDFSKTQLCFFCVDNTTAKQYIPIAVDKGNIVIDKSSLYRYDPDVPLLIPEVNPEHLSLHKKKHIIASPNCSVTPILMALKPIYDAVGVTRINVATYQSVSGSGREGIAELSEQTKQLVQGETIHPKFYSQPIVSNVIPHIDDFCENGYTKEEMKMVWETQKIFNDANILVNPTAVRVPVLYGHSAAVHIETRDKISAPQAIALMQKVSNVVVMTDSYPTPSVHAAGQDYVYVGRIREDISCEKGLDFWVVGDNLRKGAALNAVHIAELLIKENM